MGGLPLGGLPPGYVATGQVTQNPETPKKSRAGLVIGLIVVFALVVGGIAAAVTIVVAGGRADLDLGIETCEIAADGTMTATGSISNDGRSSSDVDVEVAFLDVDDSSVVDRDSIEVTVPSGASQRWSAQGSAGDDVQQITCDVTVGG